MANRKQREKRDSNTLIAARDDWNNVQGKDKRQARRARRELKRVQEA